MFIDDLKYISKFPLKSGVLANFKTPVADQDDDYKQLLADLTALDPHSLMPALKHFVFAESKEQLSNLMKEVDGFFLLLEYENIDVDSPSPVRIRDMRSLYTLTIGSHFDKRTLDGVSETLLANKALGYMLNLLDLIKADDKLTCASKRWLEHQFHIRPIEPALLFQSIGWEVQLLKDFNTRM